MALYRVAQRNLEPLMEGALEHLGVGVFETMRIRFDEAKRPYVLDFKQHLARFGQGCEFLGIDTSAVTGLWDCVLQALEDKSDDEEYRLRFIANRSGFYITLDIFEAIDTAKSIRLLSYAAERTFPKLKNCSALVCDVSHRAALNAGYDSALLYDHENMYTECSWANFFWIDKDKKIYTRNDAVLPGVTKGIIQRLFSVKEQALSLEHVAEHCVEAFITQASHGVRLVSAIDGVELKSAEPDSVSRSVQEAFFAYAAAPKS